MEARADASGNGTLANAETPRKRHPHFYLENEGGTVIFLAENTLFKVHEYFFKKHSLVFAAMFTLNQGELVEGRTDELPVPLPDVRAADFERFLSLFYPSDAGLHLTRALGQMNVSTGDLTTFDDWTSVLRLAHKYQFDAHLALAVERLAPLATPVDRILLARQYDIAAWLEDAYYALCVRDDSLAYDEGVRLGMADVILIADLRQRIRMASSRLYPPEQQIRFFIKTKLAQ